MPRPEAVKSSGQFLVQPGHGAAPHHVVCLCLRKQAILLLAALRPAPLTRSLLTSALLEIPPGKFDIDRRTTRLRVYEILIF